MRWHEAMTWSTERNFVTAEAGPFSILVCMVLMAVWPPTTHRRDGRDRSVWAYAVYYSASGDVLLEAAVFSMWSEVGNCSERQQWEPVLVTSCVKADLVGNLWRLRGCWKDITGDLGIANVEILSMFVESFSRGILHHSCSTGCHSQITINLKGIQFGYKSSF